MRVMNRRRKDVIRDKLVSAASLYFPSRGKGSYSAPISCRKEDFREFGQIDRYFYHPLHDKLQSPLVEQMLFPSNRVLLLLIPFSFDAKLCDSHSLL